MDRETAAYLTVLALAAALLLFKGVRASGGLLPALLNTLEFVAAVIIVFLLLALT
jgi:hypothetical protein